MLKMNEFANNKSYVFCDAVSSLSVNEVTSVTHFERSAICHALITCHRYHSCVSFRYVSRMKLGPGAWLAHLS